MTLTVRLDPDLEREFNALCDLKRATKSSIVSNLVRQYVVNHTPRRSAFELAEAMGLVGIQEDAPATGRDHSEFINAKLRLGDKLRISKNSRKRKPAKPHARRAVI